MYYHPSRKCSLESLEQVDALLSQISTAWVEPPNLELCIFAPYVFLERARNKLPKLGTFHMGSGKGEAKGADNPHKEVEGVTGPCISCNHLSYFPISFCDTVDQQYQTGTWWVPCLCWLPRKDVSVGSQNAWDAAEGFGCTGVVTSSMLKGHELSELSSVHSKPWLVV